MNLIHKLEPLWWMIFGAGGYIAALFLPALLLGVCLIAPLGGLEQGLAWARIHALAASPAGKIFSIAVLVLTFWHCAHHMRHLILDMLGHGAAAAGAYLSYALALAATVATVVIVGSL
jgi:fumarate reductase subunit D